MIADVEDGLRLLLCSNALLSVARGVS